jgi:hypothetical protein
MATKKSDITWDHVVGTLLQIRALTDALVEVVSADAGVTTPQAAFELDSVRKGCPPPPPRGGHCPPPTARMHCVPFKQLVKTSQADYTIESLRSKQCPVVAVAKPERAPRAKTAKKARARRR